MSKQIQILADGTFQVVNTNAKTGKVEDAQMYKAEKALDDKSIGNVLAATVKSSGTFRAACCSFLALVYAEPKLAGYKGTGDRSGILTKEMKASVREAESLVVSRLIEEGAIKLPKGDKEENTQAFLSALRDDKNYSNAKNTTNKYFAVCGATPVTDKGILVPVPVMQAELFEAIDKPVVDHSFASKLRAVEEALNKGEITSTDVDECLVILKAMTSTLAGVKSAFDEAQTAVRGGVDVQANAALEKAAKAAKGKAIAKEAVIS